MMSHRDGNATSLSLLEGCLQGDQEAWRLLYAKYQGSLLIWVRGRLRARTADGEDLADEVTARVWVSLWRRGGRRLRAYDRLRGNFSTYLAALAKDEARRLLQQRLRQQSREVKLTEAASDARCPTGLSLGLVLPEFLHTLTPRERWFFQVYLGHAQKDYAQRPVSPSNWRKLKQRVLRKLVRFLQIN